MNFSAILNSNKNTRLELNVNAVLMADIKGSRKMDDFKRGRIQQQLYHSVNYLNKLFSGSLVADVVFSAGDEIQGMFSSVASAFLYYRALSHLLGSTTLHAGIGTGDWETRIPNGPSTVQDGTCYHKARAAINQAKKSRCYQLVIEDKDSFTQTVAAAYSTALSASRTKRQVDFARSVDLVFPLILEMPSISRRELDSSYYELHDCLQKLLEKEGCKYLPLAERAPDPVILEGAISYKELESRMRGVTYQMERFGVGRRQSLDRLMAESAILVERNAAAFFVFGEIRGGEWGWR